MLAAYIAQSRARYEDDTHSGCLFQADAAGEREVRGFPFNDDLDLEDIESRMGFVDAAGRFYTRDETLALFGFQLAEDQS